MVTTLTEELVRTWVRGWARSHGYDVHREGNIHAALRSDTTGDWEYILLSPDQEQLSSVAATVAENPSRTVMVISPSGQELDGFSLPEPLRIQASGEKLMVTDMAQHDVENPLVPEGFEVDTKVMEEQQAIVTVTDAETGELAARGRVVIEDGVAVFDRIFTSDNYRRKGLGSFVMRSLAATALNYDTDTGLLISTPEGLLLYHYLGWTTLGNVSVLGTDKTVDQHLTHSDDQR